MDPISARIGNYKGKPSVFINGVPVPPQIYALTDWPIGNRSFEGNPAYNTGLFAGLGFKLFQFDVNFQDMLSEDGELDISFAVDQIRGAVSRCPDAAVMFRLHTNPPFWWIRKHPEEWTVYADTGIEPLPGYVSHYASYLLADLRNAARPSFASEKWLSYMGGKYREFLSRLAQTEEGDRLFAVQVASGLFGENHYWGFVKHDPDMSEPMNRYFRRFLRGRYGTDSALRAAWNDPEASLETARVPGMERCATREGIFRDPAFETRFSDYCLAQHKCVADSIEYFCSIVKETWPRPVLAGAFYGYYVSVFGRAAAGGHICEEQILGSPVVDFLCAPGAYNKSCREPGGPGLSRGLIESVRAHGKLWLDEMDQPTERGTALGGMYLYDQYTSLQNNRKQVLEPFIRGGGMWYYDFGEMMCSGWWEDPVYLEDISKIKAVYDEYFEHELDDPADALIVLDTAVFTQTSPLPAADPVTDAASINKLVPSAFMSGASVDTAYLSDIARLDLSRYRAVIFANCFLMDPARRAQVREALAGYRGTAVWFTAPGFNDGKTLSADFCSDICGIKLTAKRRSDAPVITLSGKIGGTLDCLKEKKEQRDFPQLMLQAEDPRADVIGRYPDGAAGAAQKRSGERRDMFFALPLTEPEQLRDLFEDCGCHIYNPVCGECTLAGAGLVMIQARNGGKRAVTLRNGRKVMLDLKPSQTAVLDAESGRTLL